MTGYVMVAGLRHVVMSSFRQNKDARKDAIRKEKAAAKRRNGAHNPPYYVYVFFLSSLLLS